jgi:hypothetical protein
MVNGGPATDAGLGGCRIGSDCQPKPETRLFSNDSLITESATAQTE